MPLTPKELLESKTNLVKHEFHLNLIKFITKFESKEEPELKLSKSEKIKILLEYTIRNI